MVKHIVIDEATVKEISDADVSYRSQQDILTAMLNQHITDTTDGFLNSAVYLTLSKRCSEALQKFDNLKNSLQQTHIPAEKGYVAKDWSLDYLSRTLTINYEEA